MLLFCEIYQFFLLLFENFIRWRNLSLEFLSMWSSEYECLDLTASTFFWMSINENFINSSKLWSHEEILAWNFLSKWSSEYGCSKVIVSTSFWMCYNEIMFDSMCFPPLKSINYSSGCSKHLLNGESLAWNFLSKLSSEDGF